MIRPRAALFGLIAFLAGPFGLLAAGHGLLHLQDCDDHDGAPASAPLPCPICHAQETATAETPLVSVLLSPLMPLGAARSTAADAARPVALPSAARSRAPPALS